MCSATLVTSVVVEPKIRSVRRRSDLFCLGLESVTGTEMCDARGRMKHVLDHFASRKRRDMLSILSHVYTYAIDVLYIYIYITCVHVYIPQGSKAY